MCQVNSHRMRFVCKSYKFFNMLFFKATLAANSLQLCFDCCFVCLVIDIYLSVNAIYSDISHNASNRPDVHLIAVTLFSQYFWCNVVRGTTHSPSNKTSKNSIVKQTITITYKNQQLQNQTVLSMSDSTEIN